MSSALGCRQIGSSAAAAEKIRIVFVIHALDAGGAERQLTQLVAGLDRQAIEPLLVVARPAREAFVAAEAVALSPDWPAKFLSPFYFAWRVLCLARLLRRFRPDIVHAFLPERTLLLAALAECLSPVPLLVANRRSSLRAYSGGRLARRLERWAMGRARRVITVSHELAQEVLELDGREAEVMANGIDSLRFHPADGAGTRRELGWGPEHFVVGMVANFRAVKRHDHFLAVARTLYRRHSEMRFVLLGRDRGTREACVRQIEEERMGGFVRVLERMLPELLLPALDVSLSTSDSEGMPNSVLEAMACGCPIVATAVGGTVEAIRDGESGLLVAPGNVAAMVAAVERLRGDALLRMRLGTAARRRVVEDYSEREVVLRHEEFYRRALAERRQEDAWRSS